MTEYWVSQGNKWCDFCKIFISNNPASIRNHELGQRHKDNVAKKLDDMRKDKAAKEKQQQEAARAIQQIEAKAKRSYQKDVATFQETRDTNVQALEVGVDGEERWKFDSTSGYYYNQGTGLYYDPKSGFYYSEAIGKWVTQEEAYASIPASADSKIKAPIVGKPASVSKESKATEKDDNSKLQKGPPPGPVVSSSLNPMRSSKGAAPSSLAVKRKRQDGKPKAISKEEAAALKAREAAKKRVEEREKPYLGLYGSR
ncbi:zinc finger protein ZOP1 [Punica granatum]|uniref:Uncharacterized protein n=2 Tax=Punica granatum TaxID=22663 RepID=A0A2I0I759_PUNGR|nr:zinc finger protein ZOP1 [Punica granatum]PKI39256.1 hypothetical protein CRG98_040312 [Punica granatum]